jgi:hydantoinase/oxoprolinase-like protein
MARDAITFELVKNPLESIADEMAVTMARTARLFVLKEAMDYSTSLFDARGEMIAQGTCLPLHLGSMPEAVRAVLRMYGGTVAPGDVFAAGRGGRAENACCDRQRATAIGLGRASRVCTPLDSASTRVDPEGTMARANSSGRRLRRSTNWRVI